MLIVEIKCLDDLPARVLEVLKTFSFSREEKAVLVLETKSKAFTTKYRSVDTVIGMPAPDPTSSRRRKNPARARRFQLRLEAFTRKKLEDRATLENQKTLDSLAAGAASSTATNKLVLELHKNEISPVGTGPPSPILQLDGEVQEEVVKFSFKSTYHMDVKPS